MFAILGSGFGLYGYLPALLQEGGDAVLLERYRPLFASWPELAGLDAKVHWARDEQDALGRADGVVLARRPADQMHWAPRCAEASQIDRLILEKPIGITPKAASEVYKRLIDAKKSFRIGYTFRFTPWGRALLTGLASNCDTSLSVRWRFMAHHFHHRLNNWKRFNSEGGGALRYYGIQVIALLGELGYSDVVWSRTFGSHPDEIETWTASFVGSGLPASEVLIESRSPINEFVVETQTDHGTPSALYDAQDPFATATPKGSDRRIPMLAQLFRSFSEDSAPWYLWYETVDRLWGEVEQKTEFTTLVADPKPEN